MEEQIATNLARVREQIGAACRAAGRPAEEVALIAVSKVHPVAAIKEAYDAGQRLFGENRVQETMTKAAAFGSLPGIEVHLIGPLQNNKTARAAELFHAVDTLAEVKTAQRLSQAAVTLGRTLTVLLEVKLSHEAAKHGCFPEELPALLELVAGLPGLTLRGLMTVPPWSVEAEAARPVFRQLRELRDQHCKQYATLTELSMGMSNDFAVAISEGSTAVRVGTAIFGRRSAPGMEAAAAQVTS